MDEHADERLTRHEPRAAGRFPAAARGGRSRPWALHLLRSLDLQRLAFAVVFLGLLFHVQLSDPDYFWHLKAGEFIWRAGELPRGDPFSFTFAGRPWALHEWLFELALYGLHHAAGSDGVRLATAAIGATTLYVAYRSAVRFVPPAAALALSLMWLPVLEAWFVPRPQIVSYLLFALMLHWLLDFRYRGVTRPLVLLPPLMVFWVNCHGAFVLGLLLALLFWAGEKWRLRTATDGADAAAQARLACLGRLALLAALATALNPDFVARWLFPFQVLNMDYANSIIQEWQSPNFHSSYGRLFLLLSGAFVAAALYRRRRPDLLENLLPLLFIAAGFTAMRHMPLTGLVLIPATAAAFADTSWGERLSLALARGEPLGDGQFRLNWLLLILLLAGSAALYPYYRHKQQAWLKEDLPVEAADYVLRHHLRGRLFNEYGDGGYLIYRLHPRLRVFIDGRTDIYGDFLKTYQRIRNGGPGWDEAFDRWSIDLVICRRDAPLRALLLQRGDFRLVHDDAVRSVLMRKEGLR